MPAPALPARPAGRAAARLLAPACAACAALLAACASSGATRPVPDDGAVLTQPTTRVAGPGARGAIELRTTAEDPTRTTDVDAAPDSVWAALSPVYGALKIPFDTFVTAERRIGTAAHRARGSFAGMRLGRLVNCGNAATGGDNADVYDVYLDVTSVATPGTSGTTALRTSVAAVARPSTMSGEPVRCVTTGALERVIADAVRARVEPPRAPR